MTPKSLIPILFAALICSGFQPFEREYYYPWLEPLEHPVQMPSGPLPPNEGTDDYEILFNAVGPTPNSYLGRRLCLAGDQNEDGYDDILAYCAEPEEVRLYFGGDPMDDTVDLTFANPECSGFRIMPTELRDLNGDGDVDIVIHNYFSDYYDEVHIYYGGTELDTTSDLILVSDDNSQSGYEGFGYFMSCGDLNGDGFDDLAVNAVNYRVNYITGKVYVYFGGPELDSIPDFTMTGGYNNFEDLFGRDISIAGDINNDGYYDMLCGFGHGSDGGCHLFLGDEILDSIPDWTYQLELPDGVVNNNIIKDLNNDGYDEIAVLYTYSFYYFQIHLFFGGEALSNEPDLVLYGPSDSPTVMRSSGDINADGYNDMIVGDYGSSKVMVFFGGSPMSSSVGMTFYLPYPGQGYGWGDVGSAGDVNGDDVDDFMFFSQVADSFGYGQFFIYSDPSLSGVDNSFINNQLNKHFILNQNYPNPFNSSTNISFIVNTSETVNLKIYDILGRQLFSFLTSYTPGTNVVFNWDGKDKGGYPLPSGTYFIELSNSKEREVKKIQIVR